MKKLLLAAALIPFATSCDRTLKTPDVFLAPATTVVPANITPGSAPLTFDINDVWSTPAGTEGSTTVYTRIEVRDAEGMATYSDVNADGLIYVSRRTCTEAVGVTAVSVCVRPVSESVGEFHIKHGVGNMHATGTTVADALRRGTLTLALNVTKGHIPTGKTVTFFSSVRPY